MPLIYQTRSSARTVVLVLPDDLRIAVHLLCESSPNEGRTITVKRQRPTPEQVVRRLREGERMLNAGKDLAEVLRHLGIARSAWKHAGGTSTAG